MEEKIIVGDFSGIQNYLYNIQRNKSATKRLKGRSTFIEIILEKIKNDLIKKLGECEKILISGGKFIIISKNFDISIFNEFKKDLEQKLLKQFYGELKIIFGISDLNNIFKNSLYKAFEDLEKNKNRAFQNTFIINGKWDTEKFVFSEDRGPNNICKFTRGDLIKYKKDNSELESCVKGVLNELKDDKGIGENAYNDIVLSNFIAGNIIKDEKIKIFENETIYLNNIKQKYLPRFKIDSEIKDFNKNKKENEKVKENDLKSFEALAGINNFNKLACLKGDIDDLGKLFMFDLKENNYKDNYKKLSKKLGIFWNTKLYDLIDSRDIYVVYAGGDDFLILGKWDEIIKFYIKLKNEFKDFQNTKEIKEILKDKNQNITFSGAIKLFGPHDTFFTVVKNTEELLKESKQWTKDQLNIFGKVIKNNDFDKLFLEIEGFKTKYKIGEKDSIISIGSLRFLLDISKKYILNEKYGIDENGNHKEYFSYGLWNAELFYYLGRNYRTKDKDSEKNKFRNYIDGMILKNLDGAKFESLTGNNDLFKDYPGEKLFIMMSYLLYKLRE